MSNTNPLREVVVRCPRGLHVLACGHEVRQQPTAYGMRTDQRRCRCLLCALGAPRDYSEEQVAEFRRVLAEEQVAEFRRVLAEGGGLVRPAGAGYGAWRPA